MSGYTDTARPQVQRLKITSVRSYVLVSCALAVVEKSSKATAVEVVQDGQQKALIELKSSGKLLKK